MNVKVNFDIPMPFAVIAFFALGIERVSYVLLCVMVMSCESININTITNAKDNDSSNEMTRLCIHLSQINHHTASLQLLLYMHRPLQEICR
jgi:hypothetical protein